MNKIIDENNRQVAKYFSDLAKDIESGNVIFRTFNLDSPPEEVYTDTLGIKEMAPSGLFTLTFTYRVTK